MPTPGPLEIVLILFIVLVFFGPKRLPELGKSLGSGMRNFKDSVTGKGDDDDDDEPARIAAPDAEVSAAPAPPPVERASAAEPAGDAKS